MVLVGQNSLSPMKVLVKRACVAVAGICWCVVVSACTAYTAHHATSTSEERRTAFGDDLDEEDAIAENPKVVRQDKDKTPRRDSPLQLACRELALALQSSQSIPRFVLQDARCEIENMNQDQKTTLQNGLQEELHLICPRAVMVSYIPVIGDVVLRMSRTTQPKGPNVVLYWHIDESCVLLAKLEVEQSGWVTDEPLWRVDPTQK